MSSGKSEITVLGFDDKGMVAGIPRREQIHTAIFGEVGSGKSIVDTILINQNINRNEGFLIVDPHGTLAQDVLRMIPDTKKNQVVYISLDAVRLWGKTVKINPLEVKTSTDRYIVAMNLVNALRNIYHDSWGPQLESLLRNGANALVEIEDSTLRDLVSIITDEKMRSILLNKVTNRDVRHFWNVLFPEQYQKDAGRSAYNKLDKILAIPQVSAILDAPRSTIDFGEIMESGKWVIVDLSSGGSDDVVSFLGTILINMVYVEARKRFGRSDIYTKPFFIYVDEAHLFAPFALRELLNTMRKANVKVTIATQTINTFPREFAKEISALVRTIICFKIDLETAYMFKTIMPIPVESLTSLTQGRFTFYSQGNPPHMGLLIASPIVDRTLDWRELARCSVEDFGKPTTLEKYITPVGVQNNSPGLTPLEAIILLLLYNKNKEMTKDEILEITQRLFKINRNEFFGRFDDILINQLHLVERKNTRSNYGDDRISTNYELSGLAYNNFFSQAAVSRRAGLAQHQATLFMIMNLQQTAFKFCIPDLGKTSEEKPDLLIFDLKRLEDSKEIKYDHLNWSEKKIAIEIETTDPYRNADQVIKNFRKNFEWGYSVWFIVFSDKHKKHLIDSLNKNGIGENLYKISCISTGTVERLGNKQNRITGTQLTIAEQEVYDKLKECTSRFIDGEMDFSANDVMNCIAELEPNGLLEGAELDFTQFSDRALKDFLSNPKTETLARKLLENRGFFIRCKDGKFRLVKRKKSRLDIESPT